MAFLQRERAPLQKFKIKKSPKLKLIFSEAKEWTSLVTKKKTDTEVL